MAVLPDVLADGLVTVFCGSAASSKSARVGAYYAGPGNRFWPMLHEAGFTERLFAPAEFRDLLDLRIGLTDLAKHESGMDSALSSAAYDAAALMEKIERFRPRVVAFTGRRPAGIFLREALAAPLGDYGEQAVRIGEARVFVLPSPSGAARRWWSPTPWHRLAAVHREIVESDREETRA